MIKTVFECSVCHELFTRPENADKDDDQALSVSLKVHDLQHDYHNQWLTRRINH